MAKMRDNNATYGIRGKVNQFVYRQRYGETVVSKPPIRVAPFTEEQMQVHSTFKRASLYAKSITTDPAMKAAYQQKARRGSTAYNMALADYFKAPEIVEIDLSAISSGTISSIVTDNFKVKQVTVSIEAADGSLVESGDAVQQPDGLHWVYTTTSANANVSGNKVSITATDLPGNSIVNEITI
ncbi:MAG: hypothetical protein EOO10_23745 [Chitinophagaceae bacterium]|nr:MAG: hypothetical protein EOO10_23745 [Chitinophagaceae bacterium]